MTETTDDAAVPAREPDASRPGTALATVPWPSRLSQQSEPEPAAAGRREDVLRACHAAAAELRFVAERPPSLRDQLAYAAAGEWTADPAGARRHAMRAYVTAVAVPLTTLAYLTAWAAARPGRLVPALLVTGLVCTALNTVPGLHWVVPDWTTLPYWPPFSWIF